jgi:hypothetical protein
MAAAPSSSRTTPTSAFAWYHCICVLILLLHFQYYAFFVQKHPNLRLRLVSLYMCVLTICAPYRCAHICMDCMPLYMCLCAAMYVSAHRYICVAVLLCMCLVPRYMCVRAAVCVLTIYACRCECYYIQYICLHNVLNKSLDTATTLLLLQVHGNTLTAAAVTRNPKP